MACRGDGVIDEWVIGLLGVAATVIVGQWVAIAQLWKRNGRNGGTAGGMSPEYWMKQFDRLAQEIEKDTGDTDDRIERLRRELKDMRAQLKRMMEAKV